MAVPLVSFEEDAQMIGVFPTLAPRPTATNICALVVNLVEKLTMIRLMQSADFRLSGLVEPAELYALNANVPWGNWANPDPTCVSIDGTLDAIGQCNAEAV